jgi:chromosome segregation ATPase
VNRFTPAYRQLERALARAVFRGRLLLARRKLVRRETDLGLLGWQQADFSEATQAQVRKLADYEREQGRLTNESGELGLAIHELRERKAKEKAEFTERHAKFQANLSDLNRPVHGLERRIARRRKAEADMEKIVADLESALGEKQRAKELENAKTSEERAEVQRYKPPFRELPNKLRNARSKLAGIKEEIQCDENDLNLNLPVLKALEERLRENRTRFEAQDTALEQEIATRVRAKRKLEKEINAVEKAKSHPYREIGRVLADCQIAPLNQPQALAEVHSQRRQIEALESAIANSLAESRAQPMEAILISWQWWVALIGALLALSMLIWVAVRVISFLRHGH